MLTAFRLDPVRFRIWICGKVTARLDKAWLGFVPPDVPVSRMGWYP